MSWIDLTSQRLSGTASNTIPRVDTYADLPSAGSSSGLVYIVKTTTGIIPFRKIKGLYLSDGLTWTYLAEVVLPGEGLTGTITGDSLTLTPDSVPGVVVTFDCASSAAVHQLVQLSDEDENFVEVVSSNIYSGLVIGAIESKPTSTQANIRLVGAKSGYTGLQIGKPVYVGTNGQPSTTMPVNDFQVIGIALSTSRILFNPSTNKVVR